MPALFRILALIAVLRFLGGGVRADEAPPASPPASPPTPSTTPTAAIPGALPPGAGAGDTRVTLDRPLAIAVRRPDADTLAGHMIAYDRTAFVLRDRDGLEHEVPWGDLTPTRVLVIHETLLREAGARRWLELAEQLRAIESDDDRSASEHAIARALALDGDLAAAAQRLRQGQPIDPPASPASPTASTPPANSGGANSGGADSGGANSGGANSGGDDASLSADHGPRTAGAVDPSAWGPLTDAQRAAALAELRAFAEQARDRITPRLRLFETDYFLFYTDLDDAEARSWSSLLDKMYLRLAELFAVEAGKNIWKGKALIFVFRDQADYHRFQREMHHTQSLGSAGMCHGFGDGHVHVAFYRQRDQMLFAHVLVHESVHGFLHRYRSPPPIPSWINEGLAEVIAAELVPDSDAVPRSQRFSLAYLRNTHSLGGMFDAPHIDGWQYGLSSALTAMMIRENKKGYVAFINAIKDGSPWRDALEQNYGATLNRLITYFGNQQRIRDLTP